MKKQSSSAFLRLAFATAVCSAVPLLASAGPALEECADHSLSAGQTAAACRRALAQEQMTDANRVGANLNLGEALITLGQPSLAVDAFDAAAALDPSRPEIYIGKARAHEARRDNRLSALNWARALAAAPNSLDVRLGRGAFYLRAGNAPQALQEFNAALVISAEEPDPDALYNRGLTLIALDMLPEAERDFSRLLVDYPNDAAAYYHRGRARVGRDAEGAISDFDKANTLSPEWADPWFAAGRMLDEAGNTAEANRRLRRAFELGFSDPWLLDRIQSLGG
ncbi:MAG: tetratricopeptide repeat protein [Pikeienuella sp.]